MVQKLTYVDDQQGTLLVKLVKKPGGIPPACVMHIKTKLVISTWQSSFSIHFFFLYHAASKANFR